MKERIKCDGEYKNGKPCRNYLPCRYHTKIDDLDTIKSENEIEQSIKENKEMALQLIPRSKLVFQEDVIALLTISRATYFNYKLNEDEDIQSALDRQKVTLKVNLRKKWYDSDSATTQIALYKLIGSEEESDRLNGSRQKIDHSGNLTVLTEVITPKIEIDE